MRLRESGRTHLRIVADRCVLYMIECRSNLIPECASTGLSGKTWEQDRQVCHSRLGPGIREENPCTHNWVVLSLRLPLGLILLWLVLAPITFLSPRLLHAPCRNLVSIPAARLSPEQGQ
jgi:hypothetical protein